MIQVEGREMRLAPGTGRGVRVEGDQMLVRAIRRRPGRALQPG